MRTDSNKACHRLIVAGFFGVLWLLFAGTWFGWGQFNPMEEKRTFAPFPRFDATLPDALGLYLHDHFGFRGWFITLDALLRAKLFHTSRSQSVVIGKDGFLFYAGEGELENYMGLKPMTDCEIESWVQLFERRARWLAYRNIPLVVAVVPDKESVYPEMMPASVPRGRAKSRMERFVEAMRSRTRVQVIDLRPALIERKKEHRTYYQTDTHWSEWGAYWAYREIISTLLQTAPNLAIGPPIAESQLKPGVARRTYDLNRMIGLNTLAPETSETVEPTGILPRITGGIDDPLMISENSSDALPRLVFFRDSFGAALMPFLGVHFSRIFAPNRWTFDPAQVLKERADAVVIEIVERRFNEDLPDDPEAALLLPSELPVDPRVWSIIDEPPGGANISGSSVRISGWAVARQPNLVERIEVFLDGEPRGEMTLHRPRADVARLVPGLRDSAAAGVEMTLDLRMVANGRHSMVWKVTDSEHQTTEIRPRQFCVAN